MKIYGYVFVVLVLSTVATTAPHAAAGPAPKNGGRATASGRAGQTGGGLPSPSGKAGGQQPGGGKGTSSINGTGMGPRH